MCLLIVDSQGSLSIDCVNCSQKRTHVSISPENGSSLIGGNLIVAAAGIASRVSVIVTFAVESTSSLSN